MEISVKTVHLRSYTVKTELNKTVRDMDHRGEQPKEE